jgi:hypothetical protein
VISFPVRAVPVSNKDEAIVYKVAPDDAFHSRSIVVVVELININPVTAGGGPRVRVLIELDGVDGPLPYMFDGVIVNVYSVAGVKPVNVKGGGGTVDVVCVCKS